MWIWNPAIYERVVAWQAEHDGPGALPPVPEYGQLTGGTNAEYGEWRYALPGASRQEAQEKAVRMISTA